MSNSSQLNVLNNDFTLTITDEAAKRVRDVVNTRVFVNESSAQYLNGMIVDWISSMQESRFVFQNPNETGNCGCGKSFSVDTASSQQSSGQ